MAGEPAGGAVVDADIAEPRHVGDVGDHGQHRHAAADHLADRLADGGMLERQDADRVGLAAELEQLGGERLGIEALDQVDADLGLAVPRRAMGLELWVSSLRKVLVPPGSTKSMP